VASGVTVALAFLLVWFGFGESDALGVLLGGAIAAVNFLGLVYLVGDMLGGRSSPRKTGINVLLLLLKLTVGAVVLWLALTRWQVSGLGVVVGIGAAILGFTVGMNRAIASPEGRHAIEEEEKRLGAEDRDAGDD
jgi:hypothetical protein